MNGYTGKGNALFVGVGDGAGGGAAAAGALMGHGAPNLPDVPLVPGTDPVGFAGFVARTPDKDRIAVAVPQGRLGGNGDHIAAA